MMLFSYLLLLLVPISILTHKHKYSCNSRAPCGCSIDRVIMSKIVGGEPTIKRTWGWMVSLGEHSNHTHFCGGSIISSSWILTAAHCVSNRHLSKIVVRAGSNHLMHGRQKREVARVFIHPDFDSDSRISDIALLLLASPLDMEEPDLARICLPPNMAPIDDTIGDSASTNGYPPVESEVVAIGWGKKAEDSKVLSHELQQVTLNTIAHQSDSCRTLITSKAKQFCAGVQAGDKDACQGDSGGPLMKFSSKNQWILAGVISFGSYCAHAEYAGVYTRVAFYSDWIRTINSIQDDDSIITAEDDIDSGGSGTTIYSHYHLLFMMISICSYLYLI